MHFGSSIIDFYWAQVRLSKMHYVFFDWKTGNIHEQIPCDKCNLHDFVERLQAKH